MTTEPYAALGAFLPAYEAERLALVLAAGETVNRAPREVLTEGREEARRLLLAARRCRHVYLDAAVAPPDAVAATCRGRRCTARARYPAWIGRW